ncbi:glutamate--cysteine ligase catalytic subunit [Nematocida sp. LUAm3]|nr:glutamate--cysteine ligase catalytic subunit [Nematocida sp. LUAm3]KAI5174514.1 glutamate--cysteine ligase catalytic subunit [Nematocida sp. LUAm2]KAI5179165.1 glutamate--cysteine ligase catalytic subunit [Nematocida sp. LUAm1]
MGLLKESKTLSWEETQKQAKSLKKKGIEYFVEVYKHSLPCRTNGFLWGDEIEQNLVYRSPDGWILLLAADQVIEHFSKGKDFLVNVEYSGYMVETTPSAPYNPNFEALEEVEKNLENRRQSMEKCLEELFKGDAAVFLLPTFPILGTPYAFGTGNLSREKWSQLWSETFEKEKSSTSAPPTGVRKHSGSEDTPLQQALKKSEVPTFSVTRSEHFPDFGITCHRRFYDFSYNIRERRGRPLHLSIAPAMIESKKEPWKQGASPAVIDSMGQGMGCCCLQVTMQSESMKEARTLYDTLGSICPLLLFLTMATPIVSGTLTETSTRWQLVSASVDCRKEEETYIKKSRYSSIDLYTSEMPDLLYSFYNDINPHLDEETHKSLLENGVDKAMAAHVASMYVRDPILCYTETSLQEDFENIQSSNWRSMRLKPPKTDKMSGPWLVEVRPMEIQPTSFENAAYSIFVIIFSRMILSLNANFYLPISKVDANFSEVDYPEKKRSCFNDFLEMEKNASFWYRENIFENSMAKIKKGSIKDIFLGTGTYCGIFGAIDKYLEEYSEEDRKRIHPYMEFIRDRVSGKKVSVATYIRKYVFNHPEYNGDSLISQKLSNDLIDHILAITQKNSSEYLSVSDF